MNVKRFTARTSREALALVKAAFGDDAVVMSTRPCGDGVEVLAMAPESVQQLERVGAVADAPRPRGTSKLEQRLQQRNEPRSEPRQEQRHEPRNDARHDPRSAQRREPAFDAGSGHGIAQDIAQDIGHDVEQLQMSTLSFQDYVRDRMLKRRHAEQMAERSAELAPQRPLPPVATPIATARARHEARQAAMHDEPAPAPRREVPVLRDEVQLPLPPQAPAQAPVQQRAPAAPAAARGHDPIALAARGEQIDMHARAATGGERIDMHALAAAGGERIDMISELRSMRGLIEQRFGALAFMEKLQRQPRQAQLAQRLLDAGFSPALIRKLVHSLPADANDETAWAAHVLERNLLTADRDPALEDAGGIYALIGATGVGKTTSTAKLAAAFATRHGAANLGLITLDAYRVGAHEQLRTYGRILGVPVHTAHDRASLEDLLDLLSAKRMILIDTAGMAQRDSRTRDLLEMLSHRAIQRILVVNASAQGETIEDQLAAYAAPSCRGLILSKLDEAVKLGPALDSMIRHKLKVLAVANGQRVPEDWHRLSANALVQRALKGGGSAAWKLDGNDVSLIFAGLPGAGLAAAAAPAMATVSNVSAAHGLHA